VIHQHSIAQVFDIAQVEDVVQEFVNLKRRGANMIGLCPFHNEKTPSFTVSPTKGLYKCFGCGKGGNAVSFVMEHEKLSYPEAIRWLANKYNIELEETQSSEEAKAEQSKIDSLYIVNEFAKDYFIDQLWNTDDGKAIGLSYFKERGYREETIKKFNLGYALNQWDNLHKSATAKGFKEEYLEQLGLIKKREDKTFDFFRDRIMFTIHNISGKPIAFAGRILKTDKKAPKYINSPETDIYTKSKVLYGMYFAKDAIRKENKCYIVEGYTDVISMHQAGIENVVASSGTSFTEEQIRLIKRYTKNITVLFDGDAAGLKAAARSVEMILEQDMNVKVVVLPEGDDPDSFVNNNGLAGFEDFVTENEKDFIFFKMDQMTENVKDDPISKGELIHDITKIISKVRDTITRSLYIQSASHRLGIAEHLLIYQTNSLIAKRLNKKLGNNNRENLAKDLESEKKDSFSRKLETEYSNRAIVLDRYLVCLLLEYSDNLYNEDISVKEHLLGRTINHPMQDKTCKKVVELFRETQNIDSQFFINYQEEKEISELTIKLMTNQYELSYNWRETYEIYVMEPYENFKNDIDLFLDRYDFNYLMINIFKNNQRIKELQEKEFNHEVQRELDVVLRMQKALNEKKVELANKSGITIVI